MPDPRRLGLLFLFGATVLVVCDGFHSYSDTTEYAHPVAFRAARWVPLLFGTAGGGGGLAYALGYKARWARACDTGTFRYTSPDVFGIPFWLPGLYLASAPAVGQLARRVLDDPGRAGTMQA